MNYDKNILEAHKRAQEEKLNNNKKSRPRVKISSIFFIILMILALLVLRIVVG